MNIQQDNIKWKKVNYLRQGQSFNYDYQIWMNEPLASWDVYDYWEKERVLSMREHLKKGDVLFDIGTESGWCNLVYASMVGPENMVLIEPTPEFWPNIKALWDKNYPHILPKGTYSGLFSNKTTDDRDINPYIVWPKDVEGDLIDKNSYKYIHEHGNVIPQMTLDDYVLKTKINPNALTIDTEGSELLILHGAENTLKSQSLKVWISEHDDMALRDYNVKKGQLETYMGSLGYKREYLAVDHEVHAYYHK